MKRYDLDSFAIDLTDTFIGALNRHICDQSFVRLNAYLRPVLEHGLVEHTCGDSDILANTIEVTA